MPRVRLGRQAETDLRNIYNYIADRAGVDRARAYAKRIATAYGRLATFPKRGTRRDDLAPGLRTVGFEGRITIAFKASDDEVLIVGLFYAGRNVEDAFENPDQSPPND